MPSVTLRRCRRVNLALAYTELTEELCRLRNLSSLQSQILRALLQEKSLNGGKGGPGRGAGTPWLDRAGMQKSRETTLAALVLRPVPSSCVCPSRGASVPRSVHPWERPSPGASFPLGVPTAACPRPSRRHMGNEGYFLCRRADGGYLLCPLPCFALQASATPRCPSAIPQPSSAARPPRSAPRPLRRGVRRHPSASRQHCNGAHRDPPASRRPSSAVRQPPAPASPRPSSAGPRCPPPASRPPSSAGPRPRHLARPRPRHHHTGSPARGWSWATPNPPATTSKPASRAAAATRR